MKNLFIYLFLLVAFPLFSQNNNNISSFCGTKAEKSEWLKKYQADKSAFDQRGDEMLYVPLTVNFLGNNDSTGFYSMSNFLDDLCTLNKDFEKAHIQFFLPNPVRYIKNSTWNNHKDYGEGQPMFDENVENTINIYIVASAAGNCGYDWPGTGIVLAKGCMGKYNHTWAHETGHELSLPHTFLGWEGEKFNIYEIAPPSINGQQVEMLNGSNCNVAGDGFCDTPPDYISDRWNCSTLEKNTGYEVRDPNGQKFKISGEYFMSYANDGCMDKFSNGQIEAMRAHLLSEKLSFLATENPYLPLQGYSYMLFPKDSAEIKSNSVTLQWSSAKNASAYYLEVSRTSGFDSRDFVGAIHDTTFTLKLPIGKKYYWRVKAFNLGFSCNPEQVTKKRFFRVLDSTSENDVLDLDDFVVFPNPSFEGNTVQLQFSADFLENANLTINDINGKNVYNQKIIINPGNNNFEINSHLPDGFYIINISTKKGNKQEKLIIIK